MDLPAAFVSDPPVDGSVTAPRASTSLRRVGFTDREIFDATAWIAVRLAFSTVNDALGAPPDPQLVERCPPVIREAVTYGRSAAAG
jgi:alkylhydroperoxidase family enzyme